MFGAAILGLDDILKRHPWAGELAGILPLSAFIDFIDLSKIHIFQLTGGAIPLWSWPVTPTGGRLLLSGEHTQNSCCLDRYGMSPAFLSLDGRYGDQFPVSNPETLRMCISAQDVYKIQNDHGNMRQKNLRTQNLEIIYVSRLHQEDRFQPLQSWPHRILLDSWLALPYRHLIASTTGWIMLLGAIIMSGIFQRYLSLAFLIVVPMTGLVILSLYGSRPRRLLTQATSNYNRLCVLPNSTNAMDCTVFYGESTIVNSLLYRPLEPTRLQISRFTTAFLRMVLRILILSQWALVLGAAALKDWDAYFITFWVAFCIFSHTYLFSTHTSINYWMKSYTNLKMERYQTILSSRRALLNTIIALNPDTFAQSMTMDQEDRTKFYEGAMKWVDQFLSPSLSRTEWEDATRTAMDKALQENSAEILASQAWKGGNGDVLGSDWNNTYSQKYWKLFILEGIYMATKIKEAANLTGRRLSETV